jgi:hypothetical protein
MITAGPPPMSDVAIGAARPYATGGVSRSVDRDECLNLRTAMIANRIVEPTA